MPVFIDASALTALIAKEPDYTDLATRLESGTSTVTNAVAMWETIVAVARIKGVGIEDASAELDRYMAALQIAVVPIGGAEAGEAVEAQRRYGKGTGHRAKLNMGDCFAYACAKTSNARLLYKGDDFSHTDLA